MKNSDKLYCVTPGCGAKPYRLIVLDCPEFGIRIQVIDCERGCRLFDWRGYVAGYLLNTGELDSLNVSRCGYYSCGKNLVCHLALVAAASRIFYAHLPGAHRQVAETIWMNSSEHLTADDICVLLAMERRDLLQQDVEACLADLASWKQVQKIEIDADNVFYDVDTRPHEHVFDPVTRRIRDA